MFKRDHSSNPADHLDTRKPTSTGVVPPDANKNTGPNNDPEALAFLKLSIDNLAKVSQNSHQVNRLSQAICKNELLENPANADDLLFIVLDTVAFYIKSMNDPVHCDTYLALFKTVPQPDGLSDWYDKIEKIDKETENKLMEGKSKDIKKFRDEREKYLANLKDLRYELRNAANRGVNVKFMGGDAAGDMEGINERNTGNVRAYAGRITAGGKVGGINRENKS